VVGTVKFEARIKKLVENLPDLAELVEPLLIVRRTLREQIGILHRRLLAIVRDDEVCRRLMTVPGVGPVVALTDPKAFKTGREFAAWIGLVPRQNSTGGKDRLGSISKQGDRYLRRQAP
jgi:transposase